MNVLCVLMWKHMIGRKRRYIATPLELLAPTAFFILLVSFIHILFASPNKPQANSAETNNVRLNEAIPLELTRAPKLILYTPDTRLVNDLMGEVGRKLRLHRLDAFPNEQNKGYHPIANISSVEHLIKDMKSDTAIVTFQDMEGTDWPRKLNYTIRIKEDYMTHIYESLDEATNHHQRFGDIYDSFMKLQWAIDSSYLKLLTGNEINQTVTLQEFPFVDNSHKVALFVCTMMPLVCFLSLMLPYNLLLARLVQERTSGVQELIKMVGVSNNMLTLSNFLNAVPAGLAYCVVGTICLKASSNPLLPQSNWFLILVALALHYCSIMAVAFACSYIVNNAEYAVSLATLSYILLWLPTNQIVNHWTSMPRIFCVFTSLLPHTPIYWFWNQMVYHEGLGNGLQFSTAHVTHGSQTPSVLLSYLAGVAQLALYLLLAWYLSMVRPGSYGVALPWSFPCQASYWSEKKVSPNSLSEEEEEEPITRDPLYYETAPPDAEVGIKILNVSKAFGKNMALNNVSFDVYKSEITVLLGHNGAGKTTLMSIITGMYSATAGQILVNGVDVVAHPNVVRRQFGLCTQHNLFFPDLTVKEHVVFFSMIKGYSYSEAKYSANELLDKLGLANKRHNQSSQLSGGMKRRLQLACALSGGSKVLILDEPTSGLDVETRRELWDLLLSLRGTRTVLLTTHFMEEADALGDRVAALHSGRLRCHATPMYLKKNIGTGYRLSLTTIGLPKADDITKAVTSIVPDAIIKEQSLNTVSYTLPANDSSKFPKLFSKLEEKRSELGIDTIGVGVSTLEEVFVKLCSDVTTGFTDETDGQAPEPTFKRATGAALCCRQVMVLMRRQLRRLWWKKISFLIFQILLPLGLICFFTFSMVVEASVSKSSRRAMDLDIYSTMPERRVLFKVDSLPTMRALSTSFENVQFEPTTDVEQAVRKIGENSLAEYNKYLVGVELNDTSAKVMFTTTVRHAAPVALNLLSNMVASQILPYSDGHTIQTYNHPLQGAPKPKDDLKMPKDQMNAGSWTFVTLIIFLSVLMSTTSLTIKERLTSTRHIHIMSGCSPATHWLTTLMTHTMVFTLVILIPTVVATHLDRDNTLQQPRFLVALFPILVLGTMAFLAFTYLVCYVFTDRMAGIVLIFIIIFGLLLSGVKQTMNVMDQSLGSYEIPVTIACVLLPPATLNNAVESALHVARVNLLCDWNKELCPNLVLLAGLIPGFDGDKCCANKDSLHMYDFGKYDPALDVIVLICQIILYMTIVILTQYGLFNSVYDKSFNSRYQPPPTRFHDEMVRAEKTYVDRAITLRGIKGFVSSECMEPKTEFALLDRDGFFYLERSKQKEKERKAKGRKSKGRKRNTSTDSIHAVKQIPDAMLVNNLHKNYVKFFAKMENRNINAVKGVSFSLKKGECFGLLGVNGAGKSTTFKMISAEESPTRGNIYANGYHLKWPRSKYLQTLGYCPQFFGLDEFLTGRENLRLLLTLRGLTNHDVNAETEAWIEVVGLNKHASKLVAGYSGGCLRRLGTAAALCSGAGVTLLDEPTAGVDVAARRRVWAALRRGLRQGRAVVITSHRHYIEIPVEANITPNYKLIRSLQRGLCSGAGVTLLDEPTAGVDVAARRRVWAALRRGLRQGRAVVITSHSMDEMEALCDRIAIMSAGELAALGSAAALRAAHAEGHAVAIKIRSQAAAGDVTDATSEVQKLKENLANKFNCTLKDEHKTMLHYHINETMRYSKLFTAMEKLKEKFPDLIEDYSVTETTLEEVFLSYAQPAPERTPNNV